MAQYEFHGPVSATVIGNVRSLTVNNALREAEPYQHMLQAVREAQAALGDDDRARALGEEVEVLESDRPDSEKTASLQRILGMAKVLGEVGVPILTVAAGLKDLLS
jgi:hypothetical protein